jgi:hypothetical protein
MINKIIENREVFVIEEDTLDDFNKLNQETIKAEELMVLILIIMYIRILII